MFRIFFMSALLSATSAVSAQAQIISNPVITSWAPYQAVPTYPTRAAVAPTACCAPPVVSFCDPCSSPAAPVATATIARYTPAGAARIAAPTTTNLVPGTAAYYVPTTTTVYYPFVPRVSAPTTIYGTAAAPTTSHYAGSLPSASYAAPAPSSTPTYSSPAVTRSSCGCRGS